MDADASDSILVYRYLPAEAAIKSIEKSRLRISKISGQNDPFEFLFAAQNYVASDTQKVVDWLHQDVINKWSLKLGFISFCRKLDDPVLWAHYADNHKGVAFEIKRSLKVIRRIRYTSNRPFIDVQKYQNLKKHTSALHKYMKPLMDDLFEHKAPSWEYEQEYRDIFDLTRNGLYELEDGFHHIGITSSELKRVILGCYCEKEEADIKRLLNQAGLNSTEVTRAKLSLDKYKIEV